MIWFTDSGLICIRIVTQWNACFISAMFTITDQRHVKLEGNYLTDLFTGQGVDIWINLHHGNQICVYIFSRTAINCTHSKKIR